MTDNAKELLALAEEIVGLCEDAGASREYADALIERLSARQQESAQNLADVLLDAPAQTAIEMARALLAKYDIFEKVEG